MARFLDLGEPAPWFTAPLLGGPDQFNFDRVGGRHVLLLLFGSAAHPASAEALAEAERCRSLFDSPRATFFGVTIDPEDVATGRIAASGGLHFLLDHDRSISRAYGAIDAGQGATAYRPHWLLIDPMTRVVGRFPLARSADAVAALARAIAAPALDVPPPILTLPNVLEPAFCRELIALYDREGGGESGFMRQVGEKTVAVIDFSQKRRRDVYIEDQALQEGLRVRLLRRLVPMIKRAFDFNATRIERYIVACYEGDTGGHFRAHRDNTTSATAHRRFAVTINLNGDYEGGDLSFPEFGTRTHRAPPGGAIVFSCSLLHEVSKVTAGRRYATLPFLYDDAAAKVREANYASLDGATGTYRAEKGTAEVPAAG